jgi:DUF4097 and DUF4098 domain-containing protein YvlB
MNRMKWMITAALTVALILLGAPLMAQTEINETRPLHSSATLSVDNISGSVTITGWNENQVQVTGTLGKGSEELRISGDASRMEIEVVLPKHSRNVKPTHLVISVPRGCRLDVDTVSANIDLSDFDGDIEFESVSGDITAVCGAGEVEASSVSGDIKLTCQSSDTTVESVSGDARLRGIDGVLSVNTVSGDMLVEGGTFTSIEAEMVSGNLQFDIGLASGARVEVDAHSGDVIFLFDGGLSAHCEVETFSGNITNEFGPTGIENEHGPGSELEFTAGAGDGHVEINTFSGNVVLKQK